MGNALLFLFRHRKNGRQGTKGQKEEENKGKLVFFGGVKSARFRKQVVPGDVLELRCEIIKRKGSVGIGSATALVDGKVAAEAELTFAIEK